MDQERHDEEQLHCIGTAAAVTETSAPQYRKSFTRGINQSCGGFPSFAASFSAWVYLDYVSWNRSRAAATVVTQAALGRAIMRN